MMMMMIGLTAAIVLAFERFVLGFDHATTGSFSAQSRIDNGCGTAHTRLNAKRRCRTVHCTSSAFHAGIPVFDLNPTAVRAENIMGTNHHAQPAARAFFRV
jgi:hypothetical protein